MNIAGESLEAQVDRAIAEYRERIERELENVKKNMLRDLDAKERSIRLAIEVRSKIPDLIREATHLYVTDCVLGVVEMQPRVRVCVGQYNIDFFTDNKQLNLQVDQNYRFVLAIVPAKEG